MEIKVKYKAVTYNGKVVSFTQKHEAPDFKVETFKHTQEGKTYDIINSVESQIMDWLDTQDKTELMESKELKCILDYTPVTKVVYSKESEAEMVKAILTVSGASEKVIIDFMVVYVKMYDSIKKLNIDRKIKIVFDSLGIGYQAKTAAYTDMLKTLQMSVGELAEKREQKESSNLLN